VSPDKRKAPEETGADATTKTIQLSTTIFEAKYAGKVRPAPREPGVSHYCCSCCRWSA
jgi:hypothetical protein